jgi:hypothetical protein
MQGPPQGQGFPLQQQQQQQQQQMDGQQYGMPQQQSQYHLQPQPQPDQPMPQADQMGMMPPSMDEDTQQGGCGPTLSHPTVITTHLVRPMP